MKYSILFPHTLLLTVVLALFSCTQQQPATTEESQTQRQEAREDSLELVAAYARQAQIQETVFPHRETDAIASGASLDAADDPAVWIHPKDPALSLIIGSNKKGGIHLYSLSGNEVAYFPVGNINNVDVLQGFQLGDQQIDIVGGSNRSDQSIDLFSINHADTSLVDIAAGPLAMDSAAIDDIYGFCFYQDALSEKAYVLINGKNGRVQQYELSGTEEGTIAITLVNQLQFDSQVEGMVADNEWGYLYVGEEDAGIWKVNLRAGPATEKQFIPMSNEENPAISFDIEGITLYEAGDSGYLIASSQGNFSYAVFERTGDNTYLGSFKINGTETIDGVEETDGIEAISTPLGPDYPSGVFIAQDGFNFAGDSIVAQNFKLVDWRNIQIFLTAKAKRE